MEKLEARCEEMAVTCEEHERCKQESASDEALQGQIRRTSEGEAQALRDQLSEVRTLSTRQATKLSELQDTIDTVTQVEFIFTNFHILFFNFYIKLLFSI